MDLTECPRCNYSGVTTRIGLGVDQAEAENLPGERGLQQCVLVACARFPDNCRWIMAGVVIGDEFVPDYRLVPHPLIALHEHLRWKRLQTQLSPEEQEYLKRHQHPQHDPGE